MDLLFVVAIVLTVAGVSTLIWAAAGIARFLTAAGADAPAADARFHPRDVAVLIAAHNEQLVIADTIRSAAALVPAGNVFVISDGSSDDTVAIARACGATVLDLQPNRGKAGAIRAGLTEFAIAERFGVVLLLDADTRLREDYLASGLALFDAPDVVAVAGRATTAARTGLPWLGRFLTAYRERTYVCTQFLQKYGQAGRYANAVSIVPGMASMYRTDILAQVDIDAAGLSIEDFNMTFEVHAKRLGRIDFHPACAIAETQDPVSIGEYARQVRRWSLGFWQTVRRHGAHVGVFWAALALFIVETVLSSIVLLLVVPAVLVASVALLLSGVGGEVGEAAEPVTLYLPVGALLVGWLVADLILTVLAALLSRTWPTVSALLFPLMRVLDAALCLVALGAAFGRPSDGRWRSPERRVSPVTVPALAEKV